MVGVQADGARDRIASIDAMPTIPTNNASIMITDADAAMTSAIKDVLPHTLHLHCLWHIFKNAKKKCQGALGAKMNQFQRLLHAAAFSPSENVRLQCSDSELYMIRKDNPTIMVQVHARNMFNIISAGGQSEYSK